MAKKRPKMPRPAAVSSLLAAALHGTPAEARLKEGAIWQVWDKAVGKQIADRARPLAIRGGILTVAVSSAPWMQQLTFLKKGIVEKLNKALGEPLVRDIYLKAGLPVAAPPAQPRRSKPRPLTAAERAFIEKEAAAVADQELREAFTSLLTRHLTATKSSLRSTD